MSQPGGMNQPPQYDGFGTGQAPPPNYQQMYGQYGQPPASGGSGWKYLLFGCGCLALLVVIAIVGGCGYLYKKAPDLMADLLEVSAPQMMEVLTDDHGEAERERFRVAMDALIENLRSYENVMGMAESNVQPLFDQLQMIADDGRITVAESQNFADSVNNALGGVPAIGGEDGTEGDDQDAMDDDGDSEDD